MSHDEPNGHASASYFSVDELPQNDRFEIWEASMGCMFDIDVTPELRANFRASVQSHIVGDLMMSHTQTTAHTFNRQSYQLAKNGLTHYLVQWFEKGTIHFENGQDSHQLQSGEILICDLARPTYCHTTNFADYTMVVPRNMIEDALDDPDDHHMRILPASSPLSTIIRQCIVAPLSKNGSMTPKIGQDISKIFIDTLTRHLNTVATHPQDESLHHHLGKRRAIQSYIELNLHDSRLSPTTIAKEFGMSRSKLYQMFEHTEGIANIIRQKRLEKSLAMILQPSDHKPSIYDIAWDCGFSNDVSFIRAFRQHFHIPPGYLRNRIAETNSPWSKAGAENGEGFDQWILRLQSQGPNQL
ncbi:helix-turn-helix domain-containing protein [Magnetovibrio sp. PR-2]|uniref:helix-turn-helix domain-containing protein n=1 Tax=Magnetovibrio sp. PR-2 TaxID=3120356 RepID=UPI002FCE4336